MPSTKVLPTPIISAGDILTEDMTTTFFSDANDIITGVGASNIAPRSLERYHIDVGDDGPVAGWHVAIQSASTGSYNNTSWAKLSHGSATSEVTFGIPITIQEGWVIRAHIFAHINDITISATSSDVDQDMYFFRLVAETNSGSTIIPGAAWGTSIFVRNSGATLTADTPIDTKAFDEKNFRKYRHVDISQLWIPAAGVTPFDLKKLRWEFIIPGGHHTIDIKEFEASFYVYKG